MPPPTTGEASLSGATPIASGAVAALAVVLGGILATAAVAHYRVGKLEEVQAAEVKRADAGYATLADHETRLRLEEEAGRRREEWEKRVEGKLDRLLEGGVRTARGGK